jgi:hypothetical protein
MKYDLPQTTQFRTDCARYQTLITKNSRSAAEDTELAALATTLADYMIKANDWNIIESSINNHIANSSNPHNTTAPQIGAETPTGAQAKVDTHANLTNPHSATSAAIVNRLPIRDANAQFNVGNPTSPTHVATKAYAETVAMDARPFVAGFYTGNGAATRDIALPFTPSAVFVPASTGNSGVTQALAVTGSDAFALTIGVNKFTVEYNGTTGSSKRTNESGVVYNYIALR